MFQIRDILVRILILGSVPLTNRSCSDLLFSTVTFKMQKNVFLGSFAYYFLKVNHYSQIKVLKRPQISRNQGFSFYFCLMMGGSGSRSLPVSNGSGRPKNLPIRIRLRTRNTAFQYFINQLCCPQDSTVSKGRRMHSCLPIFFSC